MRFKPGDRIRTKGWSPSSDLGQFTVVEAFEDGWIKAVNDEGKFRMFDALVVRKLKPNHLREVK